MTFFVSTVVFYLITIIFLLVVIGLISFIVYKWFSKKEKEKQGILEKVVPLFFVAILIGSYYFITSIFTLLNEDDIVVTENKTHIASHNQRVFSTERYMIVHNIYTVFGYVRDLVTENGETVRVRVNINDYSLLYVAHIEMQQDKKVEIDNPFFSFDKYFESYLMEDILSALEREEDITKFEGQFHGHVITVEKL